MDIALTAPAVFYLQNKYMLAVVTNGFVPGEHGQLSLHPSMMIWNKLLSAYRQTWFHCTAKNPLGWYASLCETSPTALLMQQCDALPQDMSQCWIATPYHAQLARTAVRVMPEGQFAWTAEDANELCETLNPLLADEGMQLIAIGAALLLACRESMDAYPQGFGSISGNLLPDRHHEGEDGGRLNRLLSEIQMFLFQNPLMARHERGEPEVSGIWLWASMDQMIQPLLNDSTIRKVAVATRNPVLHAIVDGKGAGLMITEAERTGDLLQHDAPLPDRIVLAGEGHAVLLKKSFLPRFGAVSWKPSKPKAEEVLLSKLCSAIS